MDPKVQKLLVQEQYQQRTPEWYAVRETMLTASDVAAALDIKPFESYKGSPRKELLKKKLNPVSFSNMYTIHGNKYEDEARRKYEDSTNESVLEFGLLVHPTYKWLGASPDGITISGKVVEIKCPISRPIIPGEVPHHYFPQVQIVMEVCDLEETAFIQYKPECITWPKSEEFDIITVKRDREWFANILPKIKEFFDEMQELKKQTPSPSHEIIPTTSPKVIRKTKVQEVDVSPCIIDDNMYSNEENEEILFEQTHNEFLFKDDD